MQVDFFLKVIMQVDFNNYDNRDLNGIVLKVSMQAVSMLKLLYLCKLYMNNLLYLCIFTVSMLKLLYLCKLYMNNQLNLPLTA
jgi:hypothetical protein